VPSRGLIVLIATVLGVVGAVAAYTTVQSAPQKAFPNSSLTSVYVVRSAVPRDETAATAADRGLIVTAQMPAQYVPSGAVTNLADIRDQVAGSDIATGEVVVRGMFVSAANNPGAAAEALPPGDVAISVSVSPAAGVGGAVQPGDKVDLLVDVKGTQEAYLYRGVPVLAVGTRLVVTPGVTPSSTPANVITFALSPADAAHIPPTTSATGPITQGVYLALDGPGSQSESVAPITFSKLIPGVALTPQRITPPTPAPGSSSGSSGGKTNELIP